MRCAWNWFEISWICPSSQTNPISRHNYYVLHLNSLYTIWYDLTWNLWNFISNVHWKMALIFLPTSKKSGSKIGFVPSFIPGEISVPTSVYPAEGKPKVWYRYGRWCLLQLGFFWVEVPSRERSHIPPKGRHVGVDDFSELPQVGYVNFLRISNLCPEKFVGCLWMWYSVFFWWKLYIYIYWWLGFFVKLTNSDLAND